MSDFLGACRRCGYRWNRLALCHCAGCCRSFSGIGAFDKHRVNFECVDPSTKRLERDDAGVWRQPGTPLPEVHAAMKAQTWVPKGKDTGEALFEALS